MKRELTLTDRHRSKGASFVTVWGLRLPAAYSAGPQAEYEAVQSAVGLVDQSYRGVLDFRGREACEFLDGVVSNVVSSLDAGRGQPSMILTPRGRVLGAFRLFRLGADHFRAVFGEPLFPDVTAGFLKYAALSEVEVADSTPEVGVVALQGPAARRVLTAHAGGTTLPENLHELVELELFGEPVTVVCAGETEPGGFEILSTRKALPVIWEGLQDALAGDPVPGRAVGWAALESLRIEAGCPRRGLDYTDEHFPAEIGWQHALSFDKCYVGQEVVARMRTYGHVNRRLFQISVESDRVPESGARVFSRDGQEAGEVTSAAHSWRDQKPLALGFVKRAFWEDARLTVELAGEDAAERAEVELREITTRSPPSS